MEYIKFSLSRDLLYFSIFAGIIGFLFYKLGMDWTFTPETIFTCLAVAVIIGIILCIFVPRRRERKNEAAFFHFCRLLKTESYFSSYSWQQRYSRFCRNNADRRCGVKLCRYSRLFLGQGLLQAWLHSRLPDGRFLHNRPQCFQLSLL